MPLYFAEYSNPKNKGTYRCQEESVSSHIQWG